MRDSEFIDDDGIYRRSMDGRPAARVVVVEPVPEVVEPAVALDPALLLEVW